MEDKHNDAVSLELGGRLWELKLTHKAMKLFTNTTRVPVTRMDEAVARYDYLVYLLFCMLHVQDPRVTTQQLDEWLEEIPLGEIYNKVAEALAAAFPEPEKEPAAAADNEEPGPLEAAGTGETASALPPLSD